MKKIYIKALLFVGVIFSFFLYGVNGEVSAKVTNLYTNSEEVSGCQNRVIGDANANFWELTCTPYSIVEDKEDTANKYAFSKDNHNYSFYYDYEIEIENVIEGLPSRHFLGIVEPTTITFSDISMPQDRDMPETFVVYKFLPAKGEFLPLTTFPSNHSGDYLIEEKGVYRLETLVSGGGNHYITYLIYETDFYYSSLRTVEYESVEQSIIYNLKVNTPMYMSQCNDIAISVGIAPSNISDCNVESNEVIGEYDIVVKTTNGLSLVDEKYTTVIFNNVALGAYISYDSAIPEVSGDITYYPQEMMVDEFALQYNDDPLALPKNSVAKFEFSDDSLVEVKVNDKTCNVKESKVECYIDPTYGQTLVYTLIDTYGNEEIIFHSQISYVSIEISNIESIKNDISIENNDVIYWGLDQHPEFDKICIFYAASLDEYECANVTSELSVRSNKYYSGDILVALVDANMNVVKIELKDILLNNGYDPNAYKYEDIEGNLVDRHSILTEVNELIDLACSDDVKCLETIEIYGKYGDTEELISDDYQATTMELPTYLQIINKGFSSKACAFNRCNETIEMYISYTVGGEKQKLTASYSFIDKLPQINMQLDGYNSELKYDFSELSTNDFEVKVQLFSEPTGVTLADGYGNEYEGVINTKFVKYIDRQGKVTTLNEPYTYIDGKDDFGFYFLEGVITLTRNKTLNQPITEPTYGKSFFIKIELADTKAPILKLIGDETMTVKQYDVFKDPEVKCEDSSVCTIDIKYYYENEETEVAIINTSNPGKYIIKYFAVDGDNNTAILTRIVNVESVNAMNATSIIIIVAIVLVFAGSIVLAIIIERKRRREEV